MADKEQMTEFSGNIKISDEVISTIATVAISEIEGVSCVNGTFSEFAQKLGKKNFGKGIKVTSGEELVLDVNIEVEYGVKIPEVAWNVQDNVKKSVELMSGLCVEKVNVHVVGVIQPKGKEKTDSQEITQSEETE